MLLSFETCKNKWFFYAALGHYSRMAQAWFSSLRFTIYNVYKCRSKIFTAFQKKKKKIQIKFL